MIRPGTVLVDIYNLSRDNPADILVLCNPNNDSLGLHPALSRQMILQFRILRFFDGEEFNHYELKDRSFLGGAGVGYPPGGGRFLGGEESINLSSPTSIISDSPKRSVFSFSEKLAIQLPL